ncbi:MAG: flagellar biosynthetic protein FliO [Myxococcales bacterium]
MLGSILLAACLSAAPSVSSATQSWDGKTLTLEVAIGPEAASSARAELTSRALRVTLPGATAADLQALELASSPVRVKSVAGALVLEAPIGRRVACSGAASIAASPSGLVATASCSLASPSASSSAAPSATPTAETEERRAILAAIALPAPAPANLVAPPPPVPAPAAAPSAAGEEPKNPTAAPPASTGSVAALTGKPDLPAEKKAGGMLTSGDANASSAASAALPTMGLLAVAGVAALLLRKKSKNDGLVHVLETASLGPKRALLLTRVGQKTLLLGSSEAGISLLASLDDVMLPEPAALPEREREEGQAGLLSRLLKAGRGSQPSFSDLLAETAEDQDLRRKLEAGLPGRVS